MIFIWRPYNNAENENVLWDVELCLLYIFYLKTQKRKNEESARLIRRLQNVKKARENIPIQI